MFDDTLDDPVQTPESSVPSPTDSSRPMTNGSNGHGPGAPDLATPTDGIGSEKSEKARSSKLKAQADKSSGEKTSNGQKSNGSKAAKSQKASAKSKPSKERGPLDDPSGEPDHVPSGDSVASSSDVLPTPAVQAAALPTPESPISFSTTTPQNDGPAPVDDAGPSSFVRANLVSLILGFAAVCLAVALVVTLLQLGNRNSQLASKNALESARSSALTAARTYSGEIASYNYQHLDQDFATVEANSTPSFEQSYSKASDALKTILIRYKSSARATILSAGVVSATASRVVVVVFLEQTVTNTTQKTAAPTRSQISMTLDYSHGRWLIDNVTTV